MSERYPWEDEQHSGSETSGAPPRDTGPLQMELDAPAAPGPAPTSPTELQAATQQPGSEDPPSVPPVVQPDGDPRQKEQTTPPSPHPQPAEGEPPPVRPHADPGRPATRERPVARKEYYSIGEVSELAGLPAHVLRYWESQFPVLNPSKNRSGNRAYQRKEIKLILLVKHLLYEEKYTVEGAKAKLDQLRRGGLLAEHTARALDSQTLMLLREDVARLRELLAVDRG